MKIPKCVNCGVAPKISRTVGDYYAFVLSHEEPTTCPASFRLDTYQHTREACIKDWNRFNESNK